MTPIFFGDSQKQLYGVYHSPTAAPPVYVQNTNAILICYPLWEEYIRTHRVITQLSNKLADTGFHVLRFDYFATGDSAGNTDQGNLAQWQEDIATALAELKDLSGAGKISIIGLRFGASLAALAAQRTAFHHLVLWDPVVDGQKYIHSMKAIQHTLIKQHLQNIRQPIEKLSLSDNEYLGYRLPNSLLSSLSEVDLRKISLQIQHAFLCATEEKPEFRQLLDHLNRQHISTTYKLFDNQVSWDNLEALEIAHVPPALIQSIVDSFKKGQ